MFETIKKFFSSIEGGMFTAIPFKIVSYIMPLVFLFSGTSAAQLDYSDKLENEEYVGLHEVYEDYFTIGASIGSWTLNDPQKAEFILKNYNSLTFENEIKLPIIHPKEDVWNFTGADKIADFARENGLKLRGHTLLWGIEAKDNWMLYDDEGNLVSKEIFYQRLREHMRVIITRYDDVVDIWDVVNEACHWTAKHRLHPDALYQICGNEYLDKAFIFAREFAGPNDKLFLNENKVLNNKAKQDNIYKTIKHMQENDIPVDGIGIQGHVDTLSFKETAKTLDKVLTRFEELGVEIQITELDMTVYNYDSQKGYTELPKWIEQLQIKKYKDFFKVLREHSDSVTNVTFWGINDAHSFLLAAGGGREDWPFVFDKHGKPKQGYYAICDF